MAWLVLQDGKRSLGVRAGALVVEVADTIIETVRPDSIDQVHIYGNAPVSPAARNLCFVEGINIAFFAVDGHFRGRMTSEHSRAGERRLRQYQTIADPKRLLGVARAVVAGKLLNQRVYLQRVQRNVKNEDLADALAAIWAGAERAKEAEDVERLRGMEGYAAKVYFGVFKYAIGNPLFTFTDRNRRPPRDPVNAALSYLYTMLCGHTLQACEAAGLDPYLGFLHEPGRGRASLSLDLAEEWRPLIDALAIGLFNHRQLSPEDFGDPELRPDELSEPLRLVGGRESADESLEKPKAEEGAEDGAKVDPRPAVYLTKLGRQIVMQAFNRRIHERLYYPPREARFEIVEIMRMQAEHLARVCEGRDEGYQPMAWT